MPRMTFDAWKEAASTFPNLAAAEKWRAQNGIDVEGLPPLGPSGKDEELPPVGGLSVEDEADAGDQTAGGLAALENGTFDFTKANDPQLFQQMYKQQLAATQREEQAAKDQFEAARQKIAERYAGPSQSEMLFALSRSMLSPRGVPGFKGFLGNLMGTFGDISTASRQADQQREDQLLALQQQYAQAQSQRRVGTQKGMLDLLKTYGSLNKPQDMGTWSESLQRFIPKNRPVPIATGSMADGRRTEKYSDGTIRVYEINGTSTLYDAAGNQITEGGR